MNIGIIGTSNISKQAVLPYQSEYFNIIAVASRSYERAHNFAEKYNIIKSYEGYDNLLKDPEIDTVYIALPPMLQEEWILSALENSKKVIVEKPICLSISSLKKIQLKQHNLMILEGIMISRHPWMRKMKEIIESEKYGKLIKAKTIINMRIPLQMESGFRSCKKLGGGVLIDEMPYWISILQETIGPGLKNISIEKNYKYGVIWKAKVTGRIEQTDVEFLCSYEDSYEVSQIYRFEYAKIYIPNFFRASMGDYKISIVIEQNKRKEKISFSPQNYYRNQIEYWMQNNGVLSSVLYEKQKIEERVHMYEEICKKEIIDD